MKGSDVLALLQRAVRGEIPRCETAKQDFVKSPRSTLPKPSPWTEVDRRVFSALKKDVFSVRLKQKEWYSEASCADFVSFGDGVFLFFEARLKKVKCLTESNVKCSENRA